MPESKRLVAAGQRADVTRRVDFAAAQANAMVLHGSPGFVASGVRRNSGLEGHSSDAERYPSATAARGGGYLSSKGLSGPLRVA